MFKVSLLSSAIVLALSGAVAAQAPRYDAPNQLEQVVVTGTRATDRTVAESISPIDVITPEALTATGTTELATALARALPSLNFPRPAITDATDAIRPAQLRGLAPDQVLVLVNGKRRHTTALINVNGSQGRGSSPVDLNAIPVAAVERIEVLRDGASALYGSDAIAGVINIVLKGGAAHGGIDATYGQYSAGDGEQYQVSGDGGFALGEAGWLHLAAQAGHADQTDRARPYAGAPGPAAAPVGKVVQRFGDPEVESGAISLNGEFAFNDAVTFYTFGTASNRDATSNGLFRPAGDTRNIPTVYPNGFLPQIANLSQDRALVAGVRGRAGGWHWDVSYNYGYNHLGFRVENSLNRSIGASSPRAFYAGALEATQNVVNADAGTQFDVGFAYPLNLAFGVESRSEKFNISPGEPASYVAGDIAGAPPGAQGFPGFRPGDAGHHDRDSHAGYVDLEADITERFSAGVAGRYEDYSDFGSTSSGKLSARYAFDDAIALRATASSGFRAPSLAQQFYQTTSTTFIGGVPYEIRTFAVTDPVARALGAEALKPEESTSYSVGLVLRPADALYITLDAYQIDIDDRIILSENLTGAAVTAFLEANGIRGVTGGRYFTNAVDTRTRGIDLVGTYTWALDAGSFDLTFGINRNKTDITRIAPNPPQLGQNGLALQRIGRVEQGRVTKGSPRDKTLVGGVWKTGDWTFNANLTRYGEFTVYNANPVQDQTFGAKVVVDLAASYALAGWTFTLGGDNVTDAYPDDVLFSNSTSGQLPYSSSSPFGFNGAFVYGRAGYRW